MRPDISQLVDRRADDDYEWQYAYQESADAELKWMSESECRESLKFTSSDLDTFHALFELKHESQMPRVSKRRSAVTRKGKHLTTDEALKMFKVGTPVRRYDEDEDRCIDGVIAGYYSPRWRARFDEGAVIEMTRSDVQVAIHRRTLPAAAAQKDAQQLLQEKAVTQTPLPRPSDLPRPAVFKKHTVWLMFTTGWGRGVL